MEGVIKGSFHFGHGLQRVDWVAVRLRHPRACTLITILSSHKFELCPLIVLQIMKIQIIGVVVYWQTKGGQGVKHHRRESYHIYNANSFRRKDQHQHQQHQNHSHDGNKKKQNDHRNNNKNGPMHKSSPAARPSPTTKNNIPLNKKLFCCQQKSFRQKKTKGGMCP